MEAILGMVLDISRLDTGSLKPELSVFRLDKLMSQIATDFTPLAAAKGLKLRVVPSSIVVKTDRNMLRRLIQNLVSNSIKYSRRAVSCSASAAVVPLWSCRCSIPESAFLRKS